MAKIGKIKKERKGRRKTEAVWKIIIGSLKYRIMYHLGLEIYFFYTYEKIFFSRITKMNMLSLFQNVWLLIKYFHWRTEIHKCLSTEWQKSKIAFSLKYRNPKVPFHWITEMVFTELQICSSVKRLKKIHWNTDFLKKSVLQWSPRCKFKKRTHPGVTVRVYHVTPFISSRQRKLGMTLWH